MPTHTITLNNKDIILDPLRTAYIKTDKILLLNDFHFGFTATGERDRKTAAIVNKLLEKYQPETTILLGDYLVSDKVATFPEYKDDFMEIWQQLSNASRLIAIRGNVDHHFETKILQQELPEEHKQADFSYLHGHQHTVKARIEAGEPLILGHGHPTLYLKDKLSHCFLTYKNTLLLPTISPWSTMGNDLFIYHKHNFPSNYFYELDWEVFAISKNQVKELGKRNKLGEIKQAQRS